MEPEQHKPEWSGITHEVGNERHVLPLYETDRQHQISDACPCRPVNVGTVARPDRFAPAITVYHHNNLEFKQ